MTYQAICGEPNGPTAGQTTFQADFLKTCFVNFLIIDNIPENQLDPSGDFSHNYVEGKIKRTNIWVLGNKLIVDYTPCNCK